MGFDDRLIYEVKRHELIYNCLHPDYRKLETKDLVWRDIAASMNCKPEICRKRWKGLRDTYKRATRIYKYADSAQRIKLTRWKYYDKMHFLNPYLRQQKPSCNRDELNEDFEDGVFETVDVPDKPDPRLRASIKKDPFPPFQTKHERDEEHNDESDYSNHTRRHEISFQSPTQEQTKNSTLMFFELLGKKVVEAKMTSDVNMQLETDVFQLVYGTILNFKKSME